MDHSGLIKELEKVVAEEGLLDPAWVIELSEFDEPPLFSRSSQVEFLRSVDESERGRLILEIGARLLEGVAEHLKTIGAPPERKVFFALTLSDWDSFEDRTQSVPTISIQVNPREDEVQAHLGFLEVKEGLAAVVSDWVARAGLSDRYCVAVAETDESSELFRVYVGPRQSSEGMKSVGDYLALDGARRPGASLRKKET